MVGWMDKQYFTPKINFHFYLCRNRKVVSQYPFQFKVDA